MQINTTAALTYSAMHEQEGMIQLFAAAKCPFVAKQQSLNS